MKRPRLEQDPDWTSHTAPAPGDLKILQAFVNTAVLRTRTEELPDPPALGRWLARWRLGPEDAAPSDSDLASAIAIREGLRSLLWSNNGYDPDREAIAKLNEAASSVPLRLRVDDDSTAYLTAADVDTGALGRLLGLVAAARLSDSWHRFKACTDLTCGSAFFDATKNLAACWCSTRCSNRSAARTWRRRRRSGGR